MKVEVTVPEEYMGDVMGMLNSRRGRIEGMDSRGGTQIIRAKVPLSEMFGYSTTLRSGTQGRGVFSMELSTTKKFLRISPMKLCLRSKAESNNVLPAG